MRPFRAPHWERCAIELEAPVDADGIVTGILLSGNGEACSGICKSRRYSAHNSADLVQLSFRFG